MGLTKDAMHIILDVSWMDTATWAFSNLWVIPTVAGIIIAVGAFIEGVKIEEEN